MELLNALAPFASLGQTLVWASLIVGLVAWFNLPIRRVLDAIQRRVDAGSAVKAGWFELSELKPLSPEQQREKTKEEIANAIAHREAPLAPGVTSESLAATYLQSEDLALRAIQTEFGVPIVRQVAGTHGARFDAAFVKDGYLHVVEVKTYTKQVGFERLRSSIARIADATKDMGGPRARLIVAVVYSGPETGSEVKAKVLEALSHLPLEIDVRVYTLAYLRQEFASSGA